ncbi:MAG: hypothetical protein U1F43_37805 [Myxococcota bacterium]
MSNYRILPALVPSLVLGLALAAGACSSTPPTETHEAAVTKEPIKDIAWKDMTKPQRGAYMKDVVMPTMKEMFVAFDPKFADMNCATCHGVKAVEDHSFKMPTAEIYVLPSGPDAFQKLMSEKPTWMPFMMKVAPKMAELLGVTPFDPKDHPDGFGCHNCHTVAPE